MKCQWTVATARWRQCRNEAIGFTYPDYQSPGTLVCSVHARKTTHPIFVRNGDKAAIDRFHSLRIAASSRTMHPLRPLTPHQSLAWLPEGQPLLCTADIGTFRAGGRYPTRISSRIERGALERIGYDGDEESVRTYTPEFTLRVTDGDGDFHAFTQQAPDALRDYSFGIHECVTVSDLDTAAAHFEIPHVPTLAEMLPGDHADAVARLAAIEKRLPFTLRGFQRDDLAVAALVDSLILAWDKGGGKTIASFLWPVLKGAAHTLLIVPAGLEEKTAREAREKFGLDLHHFVDVTKMVPGFTVANYHQLARLTPAQLAELNAAIDCIVIDEGTRIKATATAMAVAIRSLQPRFRLILSATPIKNRLGDIFWLCTWLAQVRHESAAWPYEASEAGKRAFVAEFSVVEKVSRPGRNDFTRTTPRIGNPLALHRLLAPLVLRRTKAEFGIEMPAKHVHVRRTPVGRAQAALYRDAIDTLDTKGRLGSIQRLRNLALTGPHITPKDIALLRDCIPLLERGEQILIFSPLLTWSRAINGRFQLAGVKSVRIDGDAGKKRGRLAEEFRDKVHSVAVCSIDSMSEGYDFPDVHHILCPGLVWAFDRNDQFCDRIHRITSTGDAHIHLYVAEGTIDEILLRDWQAKTASIERTLDGDIGHVGQSLAEAVRDAKELSFGSVVDESPLEWEWETTILPRLRNAERAFRQWHPPATKGTGVAEADVRAEAPIITSALRDAANDRIAAALAALKRMR